MLPIQIAGHQVEITPTLRDFINKKFSHLQKHSARITSFHIFLNVNKLSQEAEATLHIPGHEISARADSEDIYKTIDLLEAKIVRQLDKLKGKNETRR